MKFKIFIFSLFFCCSTLVTAEVILTDIKTFETGGSLNIQFEFDGKTPPYDVSYESLNNMYSMIIEFKECTSEFIPDLKITRPVHHIVLAPSKVAGYKSTRVYLYLEKKVPVTHVISENKLISTFEWIHLESSLKPHILKEIDFRANEDLGLSIKCEFDAIPEEKFIFLLNEKKKAVVIFLNTTEMRDAIQPMNSQLVQKIQTKRGFTSNGQPYSKLVFHSNQELLIDLADEPDRFFVDLYGVKGQNIDAIIETDLSDQEVVKYERSGSNPEDYSNDNEISVGKGGAKKWAYMGLGSILIVGGAFAGYLYFLDETPQKPSIIEELHLEFPTDPQ